MRGVVRIMYRFNFSDQHLQLHPDKTVYWEEESILLISDTHFGKATHFRKAGIPIPSDAGQVGLLRLAEAIQRSQPREVIFLGDLFHSELNSEWLHFKELLKQFKTTSFTLVQGNHDILDDISYKNVHFNVRQTMDIGPFVLSHEPIEETTQLYNICGHIHPGVRMRGAGRQSLRLPCFYFGQTRGIMPAFGEFTGLHILDLKRDDKVFIIAGEEVIMAN